MRASNGGTVHPVGKQRASKLKVVINVYFDGCQCQMMTNVNITRCSVNMLLLK